MSTGLGMPSAAIYVPELSKFYGVRNLIRIGTAAAYRKKTLEAARPGMPDREELRLRDIILVHRACTDNGFLRKAFNSSDRYYHEQRFGEENWLKYRARALSLLAVFTHKSWLWQKNA
jgi:purine-nucleoside phosphorylase